MTRAYQKHVNGLHSRGRTFYDGNVLLLMLILAVMALVITSWLTGLILRRLRRRP